MCVLGADALGLRDRSLPLPSRWTMLHRTPLYLVPRAYPRQQHRALRTVGRKSVGVSSRTESLTRSMVSDAAKGGDRRRETRLGGLAGGELTVTYSAQLQYSAHAAQISLINRQGQAGHGQNARAPPSLLGSSDGLVLYHLLVLIEHVALELHHQFPALPTRVRKTRTRSFTTSRWGVVIGLGLGLG